MSINLMLDLETLAVQPDACILSIAAILFDPFEEGKIFDEAFTVNVDIDSQDRFVDPNTVEWWSLQDPKVREELFCEEGRIPLQEALTDFNKFAWNKDRIWCQGPSFDIPILEHACKSYNLNVPWQYWQVRDSRTLLDFTFVEQPKATHNALEDVIRQALGVQTALKQLGIKKFVRN